MIQSFGNKTAEDIFNGNNTKDARKLPNMLWDSAARKLDQINAAINLHDLRIPPGNRLEALRGSLASYHSIRINDQYRIVFKWINGHAHEVSIEDYH